MDESFKKILICTIGASFDRFHNIFNSTKRRYYYAPVLICDEQHCLTRKCYVAYVPRSMLADTVESKITYSQEELDLAKARSYPSENLEVIKTNFKLSLGEGYELMDEIDDPSKFSGFEMNKIESIDSLADVWDVSHSVLRSGHLSEPQLNQICYLIMSLSKCDEEHRISTKDILLLTNWMKTSKSTLVATLRKITDLPPTMLDKDLARKKRIFTGLINQIKLINADGISVEAPDLKSEKKIEMTTEEEKNKMKEMREVGKSFIASLVNSFKRSDFGVEEQQSGPQQPQGAVEFSLISSLVKESDMSDGDPHYWSGKLINESNESKSSGVIVRNENLMNEISALTDIDYDGSGDRELTYKELSIILDALYHPDDMLITEIDSLQPLTAILEEHGYNVGE
eukprot:GHVP01048029.1.p1 GENE.GHVP01048029.1~~GHVP01048029.1.p1  ORF type:complete len:463 (-),score=58.01 GHVP01048029.1:211-1407(-)